MSICIDGLFLARPLTGMERYGRELLAELDRLVTPGEMEIAVPTGTAVPPLANIGVVELEGHGSWWEQRAYARHLRRTKQLGFCPCNVIPLLAPRVVATIHDISYKVNPHYFNISLKKRLFVKLHCAQYRLISHRCPVIFTDSRFSQNELEQFYPASKGKLEILYCAWQHALRQTPSEDWQVRYPDLIPGEYYFSLATVAPNKNFRWIWQCAKQEPSRIYAIAGGGDFAGYLEKNGLEPLPNLHFLGYVADEDVRALQKHCKAFLFPTLYEGFGLPPLEAMACGAPVIVSDTPCMHEVFGDSAVYIDPQRPPEGGLDRLPAASPEAIAANLARYSWTASAQQLLDRLRQVDRATRT